ncbi:MAG TPA: hypothetical protein DHV42_03615 [Lachnospiraceae bacterium]|nr:hypothetical protein [Lachnospiraceae bacterium]
MAAKENKSEPKQKKLKKGKLPVKQTLNLVYKEKDTGRRVFVILAVILFVLALIAFGWFIVRGQLSKVAKARRKYESLQQELTQLHKTASGYEGIDELYSHYGRSYMNAEESALQNRIAILRTINENISISHGLSSIQLTGNTATVSLMSLDMKQVSAIVAELEANPIVSFVTVDTASMDEKGKLARRNGSLVQATLTIEFTSPAGYEEAEPDDGKSLLNDLAARKAAVESMGEE